MKINYLLFLFILIASSFSSQAQMVLPELSEAKIVEALSDEADESSLFPYNDGESLYFYRTYLKEKGDEIEILRQNIWYVDRKQDKWSKADRLFSMDEFPGEILIIGSSALGDRVYLLQTLYNEDMQEFKSSIKYVERNEKGRWSDLKDLNIPGFEIGDRFAQIYINQAENIALVAVAEDAVSQNDELFVSLRTAEGNWSELIDLGPGINTNRPEISPFIAEDGKTLFFSSEGHGANGGSDVFVAYRLDDSWSHWTKPKNLGDSINSKYYDDNFVMLANGEYYFTSNRNGNTADIYSSYSEGRFSMNRGKGLAMATDQGLSLDLAVKEDAVYDHITTEADGSFSFMVKSNFDEVKFDLEAYQGESPVFVYKLSDEGEKVSRQIFSSKGNDWTGKEQTILAKLDCDGTSGENKTMIIKDLNGFVLGSYQADARGVVQFPTDSMDRILNYECSESACQLRDIRLLENGDLIALLAIESGRIDKDKFKSQLASKSGKEAEKQTIPASSTSASDEEMRVYFDFNAIGLNADQRKKLIQFAAEVKKDAKVKISLLGFTDNLGSEEINLEVGRERAKMVKQLLIDAGIDPSKIQTESLGEENPIAPNQDSSGRAKNRRVEILVE